MIYTEYNDIFCIVVNIRGETLALDGLLQSSTIFLMPMKWTVH